MRRRPAPPLRLCLLALLLVAAPARARGEDLDAVVSAAVRSNYEALHGCYRKQLARDRSRGGTVFVRVTLGAGDAVQRAKLERDEVKNPEVAACIVGWVKGWTLRGAAAAGAEAGSEVVIPLTFRPAPRQFSVRREDVPELPLEGAGSARPLLTDANAGARLASLTLLAVKGKLALPARAGVDQALYVLSGVGTITVAGRRPVALAAGDAVWLGPEARGSLASGVGLQAVQVFAPAGLEQLYRSKSWPPPTEGRSSLVVVRARQGKQAAGRGGLRVTRLLDQARLGHRRLTLGVLEAPGAATLPEHGHAAEAELLYVLEGTATTTAGGTSEPVAAGHALYLPPGVTHEAKLAGRLRALQLFVPGGPEAAGGAR